ncbi:hypothetical protein [Micromonospora sp. NBC_00860]|uniref:hypothetical protein n=1 Tax=Micromonospora sp. NBC_00860 TaxID=2975980 RepID=UPI003867CB48|nr:hypothetical protein OH804_04810 [Micromonospora sp. NBC_00860]
MNHWEIILGILFGLLVNEVTDISPWAARKLAQWSAYRWTTDPEMAAGYAEEWTAVIDDRPGKLLKLLTAVRFTLGAAGRAAPRAANRAIRSARDRYRLRKTSATKILQVVKHPISGERVFYVDEWKPEYAQDLELDGVAIEVKSWRATVDVTSWHENRLWQKRMMALPGNEHGKLKGLMRRLMPRRR